MRMFRNKNLEVQKRTRKHQVWHTGLLVMMLRHCYNYVSLWAFCRNQTSVHHQLEFAMNHGKIKLITRRIKLFYIIIN